MRTVRFVHRQDGYTWIGYLVGYPDYRTQGAPLPELKEHLVDLYQDPTSGELRGIRKVDELVVPRSVVWDVVSGAIGNSIATSLRFLCGRCCRALLRRRSSHRE